MIQFPLLTRRILAILAILTILFAGESIGKDLVKLTGGSTTPAPYTALSYANPEQAANPFPLKSNATFVITNGTLEEKSYDWYLIISGKSIARGTVTTTPDNPTTTVTVPLTTTGEFIFGLKNYPQKLTGTVREDGNSSRP
jgi:hypothetical protein